MGILQSMHIHAFRSKRIKGTPLGRLGRKLKQTLHTDLLIEEGVPLSRPSL
jgi:hypothetical protein